MKKICKQEQTYMTDRDIPLCFPSFSYCVVHTGLFQIHCKTKEMTTPKILGIRRN